MMSECSAKDEVYRSPNQADMTALDQVAGFGG
jgi:hypothetical protein